LPDSANVDLCLILDPMLATGGSATGHRGAEAMGRRDAGPHQAGQPHRRAGGVEAVTAAHLTSTSTAPHSTGRSTRRLHHARPGDAGDRQFGTGGSG